jgi:hypothetical protein
LHQLRVFAGEYHDPVAPEMFKRRLENGNQRTIIILTKSCFNPVKKKLLRLPEKDFKLCVQDFKFKAKGL